METIMAAPLSGTLFIPMSGKITALKLQKRNRQRVNVYLDGTFTFGLSRISAGWLVVGQELNDEKIASLLAEDAREVAYQRALHLLEHRMRSENEIRQKLASHEISAEVIDDVIARLRRSGLVNDQQFAKAWVENRSEFRPRGRRAMSLELRQHGLDREVIDQALADVDEEALAYKAAQKQARKLAHLEATDFRQKMYGFLARKGFDYEVITSVISRICNENGTQDVDDEYQ